MRDLLQSIVDSANAHADYADARHVHKRTEAVETRNGGVDRVANSDEEGIGVRVRIGGGWRGGRGPPPPPAPPPGGGRGRPGGGRPRPRGPARRPPPRRWPRWSRR